jgi:hypothetical protein
VTDTPEPSSPTPFFAAGDSAAPGRYEEFQPEGEDRPLVSEPPRPSADPLGAPGSPPPPAWPPPATEGAAQPELEQLLRDVRGALATLPGEDPEPPAATPDPAPAAAMSGPDLGELRSDVAGLQRAVGELHDSQAIRHSELTARLDALARSAADAVSLAAASSPAAAPAGGPDDITMTDLHDGLAGVRTDVASLPDAIGPAVTSAVAHGLSETTRQVDGVSAALTETVTESGQLRAELASLQVTLASLHEQVSLLPQVLVGLRDVTDRLGELAPPPPPEPMPDVAGIVDDRLAEHLTAFGTGLGERLDSQLDAMHGLVAASPAPDLTHDELVNDMGERLAETERRLAERLDVLRATDTSGQLARQLEGVEGRMRAQLTAASAGEHDVAEQLRAAELRITQHVDEAVLALAQAVLGSRVPVVAPVGPTFEPTFEPVAFEPVAFEPVAFEPAAADLTPVPVYGTDDLGLLPPETAVADAADPDEHDSEDERDSEDEDEDEDEDEHEDEREAEPEDEPADAVPEHAPVEAWAKGDAAYAEVDGSEPAGAGDEPDLAEHEQESHQAAPGEHEPEHDAERSEPEHDAELAEPAHTLHTVGSPADGDPARPELPPPVFDPATSGDVLPDDPAAEPTPKRRGLFRRKH